MMRTTADFKAPPEKTIEFEGNFTWSAPSNIALVKYWGKKDHQIPANPSLSFTLDACKTITSLAITPSADLHFEVLVDGDPKPSFNPKIAEFLARILPYCSYLQRYSLKINTVNTFPHSAGIASSASGMAALALNIMSLEKALYPKIADDYFYQKASFLARLGSGSACRSIREKVVIWGEHQAIADSSDLYGVAFQAGLHPVFEDYQDTILLVDKGEKPVSSTIGHNLMNNHPFASSRFTQAYYNIGELKNALLSGDLDQFISIVESEALTLHAMMMTSNPYFILMKPNTLHIISHLWAFRKNTGIPVCFTLDAGANVHILYPKANFSQVLNFIEEELLGFCQNDHYICDNIGQGSTLL